MAGINIVSKFRRKIVRSFWENDVNHFQILVQNRRRLTRRKSANNEAICNFEGSNDRKLISLQDGYLEFSKFEF